MAMTPSKRKQSRARDEAQKKARRDQRLGLVKKSSKKTSKRK
jgi:hypothetical protein